MRTLKESLFDNGLTASELPIEKEIKQFRNKDIAKLTSEEIKQKIHSIMGSCEKYTYDEFKKHPVDLLNHVVILPTYTGSDVCDYIFVYSRDIPNWGTESIYALINKSTRNWRWEIHSWRDLDRFKDWEVKVNCMKNVFIGSNVETFYVFPEGLSKDLIKVMSGK